MLSRYSRETDQIAGFIEKVIREIKPGKKNTRPVSDLVFLQDIPEFTVRDMTSAVYYGNYVSGVGWLFP